MVASCAGVNVSGALTTRIFNVTDKRSRTLSSSDLPLIFSCCEMQVVFAFLWIYTLLRPH